VNHNEPILHRPSFHFELRPRTLLSRLQNIQVLKEMKSVLEFAAYHKLDCQQHCQKLTMEVFVDKNTFLLNLDLIQGAFVESGALESVSLAYGTLALVRPQEYSFLESWKRRLLASEAANMTIQA